mmetsp:Transcript_64414/g.178490  ORF Transcript_64414/g.178490 Transcript_64414/m.178490 type:complete len:264 (-) Transcript_64414:771-1562(-)
MGDALRETVGGSVGAVFCTYAGIPFDTVKVRMQTYASVGPQFQLNKWGLWSKVEPTPPSSVHTAVNIATKEGGKTFFRGSTPALMSAFLENTVLFGVHGIFGRWLGVEENRGASKSWGAYGKSCMQHGMSGFVSSTVICPAEVLKVRLQAAMSGGAAVGAAGGVSGGKLFAEANALWRSEGARGFFRGLGASWGRDVPFYIVFFSAYELLEGAVRTHLHDKPEDDLNPLAAFMCGGLAGSIGWATVFPSDIIKSRQQNASCGA